MARRKQKSVGRERQIVMFRVRCSGRRRGRDAAVFHQPTYAANLLRRRQAEQRRSSRARGARRMISIKRDRSGGIAEFRSGKTGVPGRGGRKLGRPPRKLRAIFREYPRGKRVSSLYTRPDAGTGGSSWETTMNLQEEFFKASRQASKKPSRRSPRPEVRSGGLWTFAPDFLRELSDCAAVAGAAVRKS
jgi:hypothetical protein